MKNKIPSSKKYLALFFGTIFIVSTGMLQAQQTDTSSYAFSLKQTVDFALQHNNDVKNALLDQAAAKDKVMEVMGTALPQFNASAQTQDYLKIPTTFIPAEFFGGPPGTFIPVKFGTQYNTSAGISGSQLVFSGTWIYSMKGAKVYQDLAQKNTARTEIEAVADVTKAYYTALVNQKKKDLLNANLDRLKKMMDDTKALFTNGFVEKIDVDRITVAYNNLVTDVANAQRLLDLSIVLLKYQAGMDQSATLTLTDNIENITFAPPVWQQGKFDYTNRIEFQLADLNLRGSQLFLKADRAGYLPTVALFGTYQVQAMRSQFDIFARKMWYPIAFVGLQINLPIFDGLQRHYRIEQDRIGVLKAQNTITFLQSTIDMQQSVARVTLQNSAATLDMQKANMDLAQEVFDVARKKFDQGLGSNLEIINAQTALKEAQTNYFNALYDAVVAKVEYDKAMGLLSK